MPDSFSHLHNRPYVNIYSNMNQKNLTIDYTIWCRVCRYRIFLFFINKKKIKGVTTPKQKKETKQNKKNRIYHNNDKFSIKQKITDTLR